MGMNIQTIRLHHMQMTLKNPFVTSMGTFQDKQFFVVEAIDVNGYSGFGETVAFTLPWYTGETFQTTAHILKDVLIPMLSGINVTHPEEIATVFRQVKRNQMAKAGLEGAIWDLYAKQQQITLAQALGGEKRTIEVGVSLGIDTAFDMTLEKIETHLQDGYRRVKVKIKPGHDVEIVREIRRHFPDLPFMVDANGAYDVSDIDHLRQLDKYDLLMIEQPFAEEKLHDHTLLQQKLETPICLDESIHSYEDAAMAIALGSCQIINIKIGRVGGLTEAKRIHDLCQNNGMKVWCGGMLEAGIGRAHNIAISTLSGFVFPGDTSASSRYFAQDIITPEVTVENGLIHVPDGSGIGFELNHEVLKEYTREVQTFSC